MKMTTSLLLAGALSLALGACDTDPGKGKPRAEATDPAPVPTAPVAATRYAFSAADSKLEFVGAKVTGKHDGSFKTFSGTIELPAGDLQSGRVTVEIEMASLVSDNPKLTQHLKSGDFFDVEKHPKARFVSTALRAGGTNGATHTVTGNLELKGVTKSITFPAKLRASGEGFDVDAELAIDRKDFGVVYAGMPDDLIRDDVLIKLAIRAKKTAPS